MSDELPPDNQAESEKQGWSRFYTPPEKVDADEVLRSWAARRDRSRTKREARTREQNMTRMRTVIAGVFIFGALGAMGAGTLWDQQSQQTQAEQSARIDELTAQREAATQRNAEQVSGEEAQQALAELDDAARKLAGDVARAQNDFAQLNWDAAHAEQNNDGLPSEAELALVEHRRVLAPFFTEATYSDAGDAIYGWSSTYEISPATLDPRMPWFLRYDGLAPSEPGAGSWVVDAVLPDLENQDLANVLWAYRNAGSDDVLAWAKGVYAADDQAFQRIELTVTTAGRAHQKQTDRIPLDVPEITVEIDPDAVDPETGGTRDQESGDGNTEGDE